MPFLGSADIVAGLAWLLKCDSNGTQRPAQGAAGSLNRAQTAIGLSSLGDVEAFRVLAPAGCAQSLAPGVARQGCRQQPGHGVLKRCTVSRFLGNVAAPLQAACVSDGSVDGSQADSPAALLDSLACASAAVRASKQALREPGATLGALLGWQSLVIGSQGAPWALYRGPGGPAGAMFQALLCAGHARMQAFADKDVHCSSWLALGQQLVNFGAGPVQEMGGHRGEPSALPGRAPIWAHVLPTRGAAGLRMPLPRACLQRLLASPVWAALAPRSGPHWQPPQAVVRNADPPAC